MAGDAFLTDGEARSFERALRAKSISWEAGLTDTEIEAAEAFAGTRFPPDLRAFLGQILVTGSRFPNWRKLDKALRRQLDWPLEGLLFDIEHNDLWLDDWGEAPRSLRKRKARLREIVAKAPVMVPVFAHRCLPAEPCEAGNPVYSIWQSDIILYGVDLKRYLSIEFGDSNWNASTAFDGVRSIRFWGRFLSLDMDGRVLRQPPR